MKLVTTPQHIVVSGIDRTIGNILPGATYDRKTKSYFMPHTAAPLLLKIMPSAKSNTKLSRISDAVLSAERRVEKLKTQGTEAKHPLLMKHQLLCSQIADVMPGYGFFLETGTGKTILGLQIISDKPEVKWLVVCPKTIIETAWLEDSERFFPHLKIMPYNKSLTKREFNTYRFKWGCKNPLEVADALITNYESFRLMREDFENLGVAGGIFDESVKLKNPTASVTKEAIKFSQSLTYKYLMSGIPAPNSELEYFSQMQIIDPVTFGTSFYKFRGHWFSAADYFQREWKLNPLLTDQFMKRLASRSIVIRKEDCLDLPEKVNEVRKIRLSPKVMKYYMQMHKERVLAFKDKVVAAPNKLTQLMKLRQITSGFVIDNDAETNMLHKEKLNALREVLDDFGPTQVIIWCNFRNEIRTIKEMLGDKAVTAYSETKDTNESIRRFKNGDVQYMIAHPQTLKYGATFVEHCNQAVYYSMSYSYDDFGQSQDRIHRYGQDKKCTYVYLVAKGTIDETIYDVVMGKKTLNEGISEILSVAT